MAIRPAHIRMKSIATLGALAAALMLGACAESGDSLEASLVAPKGKDQQTASASDAKPERSELEKATEYWGKKYKEKPTELEPALSYAKNLRAMGERQQALAVIQQAAVYHGEDRQLASEYGRLALELDQISVAKQMLAIADDPAAPDWRVVSARGTVLAKEGKFRDAIPLYEKALNLSQDQPSVLNNLAMAYAMNGEAARAEEVLRRLDAKGGSAKTRQNLALVLGLQGKFDEAKQVSARDLGAEGAAQNSEFMRRMVKVDAASGWSTTTKAGASRPAAIKAVASGSDAALPAAFDPGAASSEAGPAALPTSAPVARPLAPASPATLRGMTP